MTQKEKHPSLWEIGTSHPCSVELYCKTDHAIVWSETKTVMTWPGQPPDRGAVGYFRTSKEYLQAQHNIYCEGPQPVANHAVLVSIYHQEELIFCEEL